MSRKTNYATSKKEPVSQFFLRFYTNKFTDTVDRKCIKKMLWQLCICCLLLTSCKEKQTSQNTVEEANVATPQVEKDMTKNTSEDYPLSYIIGKFDPASHEAFTEIPEQYCDRPGQYLRKDALKAFINMYEDALKEGIFLQIRSATRNFDYQKGIWERKWTGETLLSDGTNVPLDLDSDMSKALKILEYSSMPGTSRHHWGTDIDINDFENAYFESGEGLRLYNWMLENASSYGFCQPYTKIDDNRPHGYFEEKWHWSYFPVSKVLTNKARAMVKDGMIKGFFGSQTANKIGVVEKYILGVDKSCF